jgi:hypothetical protein
MEPTVDLGDVGDAEPAETKVPKRESGPPWIVFGDRVENRDVMIWQSSPNKSAGIQDWLV